MHGGGWFSYIRAEDEVTKRPISWTLIRRVLGYAKPYRTYLIGLLVMIIFVSSLKLLEPLLFRILIDEALTKGRRDLLNIIALGIVIIPLVSGALMVLQRYLNSKMGEGVIFQLRSALYAHMQKMSLRFFTHTKTGELMSRLNNDVVGAQGAINDTLIGMFTNIVMVVATLVMMLLTEWRLTLLGLVVVPLFVLPARRVGLRLRGIVRQQMDLNASMNAMMNETLNVSGALLVKLFGRTNTETERFRTRAGKVMSVGVQRSVIGAMLFASLGLIATIGTALTYWVGGHLMLDGLFSLGQIVQFASYLTMIYGPLQALANMPVEFASSMVSFERVFEVLDLPIEIDEKPNAIAFDHVRGDLVFDQVSFSYEDTSSKPMLMEVTRRGMDSVKAVFSEAPAHGHKPALDKGDKPISTVVDNTEPVSQARTTALQNLSFHIQPGQLAALVGPSGAGKTTITYLIPRLYDPTAGRILLDGHDLRDITLNALAENIGMVTQETYLFHDTIRTNLLYAKPNATHAEIEAAARAANIHDFIMGLSEGYDTIVGERGYRLSGGEKQRIAIARVILKDPRILVLDEATSHLDSQSEALIQAALETVMQGRTSLVIAHRLSTILAADLILVMDRGQIVEQGTHAELMAQGGLYTSLYETQFNRSLDMVNVTTEA